MAKNAYRKQALSDEQIEELAEAVEEKEAKTRSFFRSLFSGDHMSSTSFVKHLPFVAFLALLAIVYIANRHYAESNARQIDRLSREVKELSWDYKSLSAELMKQTTQTEIARKAEVLGLKERTEPPFKVNIGKDGK